MIIDDIIPDMSEDSLLTELLESIHPKEQSLPQKWNSESSVLSYHQLYLDKHFSNFLTLLEATLQFFKYMRSN